MEHFDVTKADDDARMVKQGCRQYLSVSPKLYTSLARSGAYLAELDDGLLRHRREAS